MEYEKNENFDQTDSNNRPGQFLSRTCPEGLPNLPHSGASSAIMTCSPWIEITLYRTETHDGGYRDWYRPIVPYLNI